ncbi:conserved hypothetical protein [Verticillium alfalfae VaMs.102]|uniref:Actin n=1 Tax=Verticillium alfalfae (strain VaMs.102 / ATCC MYA-4576 / FGSC 10136) TaxID=526221 RepID=C9SK49_VERA1|nr:conserved hypothetical protein [Verticillium alfalfae VaMs.102]EEY19067.1 conserved hypothetical protein [Verticillium alfalfae VaMs.102]
MAPSATDDGIPASKLPPPREYPPAKIFPMREARFDKPMAIQHDGREKALARPPGTCAIVIDNGSNAVRAGWSFEDKPRMSIPPIMSKYRDRKAGKTYSFAGNDCYADANSRSHVRNAFEQGTGIVTNWDAMEHVLDYIFLKLGMNNAEGNIDMPIVMTEAVANFSYVRKTMNETLFECYGAPSVAYGIDSLFSYRHNKGTTGLVVSSSHTSTHVIPVYNQKAMLAQATRLNWGGWHSAEYLLKLLRLKYPAFVGKLSPSQAEHMILPTSTRTRPSVDWSKSMLHAFARGPRPFDTASQAEANQIHLNVERIRVPEVVFRPSIAGVDQAGLVEITGDILTHRLVDQVGGSDAFLKDVFLTGGNTLFKNFDQRLRDGLAALLPAGSPLRTRRAADPLLDAWRGAAEWSGGDAWKAAAVTKAEYEEKGHEYLKEHDLGNNCPPV